MSRGPSVVPRRDEDPKTLDPGRVNIAMRARKQGDERYPFLRGHAVRRSAMAIVLAVALVAAAVAVLLAR